MGAVGSEGRAKVPKKENIFQGVRLTVNRWPEFLRVFVFLGLCRLFCFPAFKALPLVYVAGVIKIAEPHMIFYPALRLAWLIAEWTTCPWPVVVIPFVCDEKLFDHVGRQVGSRLPGVFLWTISFPSDFKSALVRPSCLPGLALHVKDLVCDMYILFGASARMNFEPSAHD